MIGESFHNITISIHALREEGDASSGRPAKTTAYFYPRPPRGGRPPGRLISYPMTLFLSTPSARRATSLRRMLRGRRGISIHALREEGDLLSGSSSPWSTVFLSTPSARRATKKAGGRVDQSRISIHALREEGDLQPPADDPQQQISIHALREEGDRGTDRPAQG